MEHKQKKIREPVNAAGTIAKGYEKERRGRIRKLASLMDGDA